MNLCDACHVSTAKYVARKGTQELYFCGHHYSKHEINVNLWADFVESLDKTPALV